MLGARVFACGIAFSLAGPSARAEVVFGSHVYIGGHDVSHQSFDRRHRGAFYLYSGRPPHPGCVGRSHADGSRTKVCRFAILH
jgi:hypothetical protein